MINKKRLKLKKFSFNPATTFIILLILAIILSLILSAFKIQDISSVIGFLNNIVSDFFDLDGLFNFRGLSNVARNFLSFIPLCILLICLIGLSVYRARHPITTFAILTLSVMIISSILSSLGIQASVSNETAVVKGLFNFEDFKYLISNATQNFVYYSPISTLLIGLIGLSVAHASGLIDTFIKRVTLKINNRTLTFIIIFLATVSSIINEVGYVILIPLSALVFLANGRNPLLGITASFCGVAFGYGVTLFAGSAEISLVEYTEQAALIIDSGFHVSLLSNLFAIIGSTFVVSIVGTYIIENVVSKKIGRYHLVNEEKDSSINETKEIKVEDVELEQQKKLEQEIREKKGLRNALITFIIFVLIFIYMLIPGLPVSGLLLDMNETVYINQLFGEKAYFQEGFTFLISVLFLAMGIAYAIGAKTIKNDKELVEKSSNYLKDVGYIVVLLFFASQFIAIYKRSNIGTVIVTFLSGIIKNIPFSGLPLIITILIIIGISSLFVTSQSLFVSAHTTTSWSIFAPVVVPILMQNNISPQFAQFVFRAGDSMAKGFTPLLAFFVIYLAYLNIYNTEKEPITIKRALSFVAPYCFIISITWIMIVSLIYITGLPIGPGISPVL